jgi:hypothetical protein
MAGDTCDRAETGRRTRVTRRTSYVWLAREPAREAASRRTHLATLRARG